MAFSLASPTSSTSPTAKIAVSYTHLPVAQEVKGGLVVDVGVRAFVPASQVERGYVNDLSKYVGQALRCV